MLRIKAPRLRNLSESLHLEWLETNGLGGYASSTVLLAHTRGYHGLLVASLDDVHPKGRHVLLSKVEEVAHLGGTPYLLSTNLYQGEVVHPSGFEHQELFIRSLFPTFTFRLGEVELGREVFMVHSRNCVVIVYTVKNLPTDMELRLEVRPLVAYRHFHKLAAKNPELDMNSVIEEERVRLTPYESLPPLFLYHDAESVEPTGHWYDNFHYPREEERGLPCREDLFNHCLMTYVFQKPGERFLAASLEEFEEAPSAGSLRRGELERRTELGLTVLRSSTRRHLRLGADQFLIRKGDRPTVAAAYPWQPERMRDSLIALPGLTLAHGRPQVCRETLESCFHWLQDGLLPDHFSEENGEPVYTAFEPSLWFLEAIWKYLRWTDDWDFLSQAVYDRLARVIDHFIKGTSHEIRMDPQDFLLEGGVPGLQLTWMNAKDGGVVTPRMGKPVEVQALWYNALRIMARLTSHRDPDSRETSSYFELASNVRKSFNQRFWSIDYEFVADNINWDGTLDLSLRPNQILSASLSFPVLERVYQSRMLEAVRKELWTPYGLRTLSPQDPRYRSRYEGNVSDRVMACHQGPAWSWLLGPYYNALFRAKGKDGGKSRDSGKNLGEGIAARIHRELAPLREHLEGAAGVGGISSVFDGDPPHTPRGTLFRAATVGEISRLYAEYLLPVLNRSKPEDAFPEG